jgi:excinuclease UvrABC helicase subunit UvrB
MDIALEPDDYTPSIDDVGNYVDKIPSFNNIKIGLRCSCGSRKDKYYASHAIFASHIKTKIHKKWLNDLNLNKANYYVENEKNKETIRNQQLIIANMDKEMKNKSMTIDYLTQQLCRANVEKNKQTSDLLDFE